MGVGDADKGVEMLAQVGLARGLGEGQQAGKGKGVAEIVVGAKESGGRGLFRGERGFEESHDGDVDGVAGFGTHGGCGGGAGRRAAAALFTIFVLFWI